MGSGMTRRSLLALVGMGAVGAAALAACGATPTPQVVEKVVTQEVEKEVTKIVAGTPEVVKETAVVKEPVVVEQTAPPVTSGPPVTISVHFENDPNQTAVQQEWTAKFEEANPNIHAELVFEPWSEWQVKQLTLAAAGQTPDIMSVHIMRAQILSEMGALLPVDDWVAADASFDTKDYYPPSLVMFTWKDKLYGFPWDWGSACLAYNKNMFDAASEAYPNEDWTFDDMLSVATRLTKEGNFGFDELPSGDISCGPLYLGPWGGAFVNDEETKCLVDTAESKTALQWWADLRLKHKVVPTPADYQALQALGATPFLSGKVGMCPLYPWSVLTTSQFANFGWDVAPWPKGPVTRISGAVGSGYGIGKDSQHPQEAWLFLRWFASKEGHAFLWGSKGASLPARRSAQDAFLKAPGQAAHAKYWVDALDQYAVMGRPISSPAYEFTTIVGREFELIFLGEKSVEEGAAAACADAQKLLDESQSA